MTACRTHRWRWLLVLGLLVNGPTSAEPATPGIQPAAPPALAESPRETAAKKPEMQTGVPRHALDGELPHDPLLRELLAWADRNNADIELANARLRQAEAERALAAADRRPWLHGGLNAERKRLPESSMRDGDGNRHRIPAYRSQLFDTHLSAGYEIDLFGRQQLRAASAEALLAAGEAEWRAVRLSVRHEVIAAYADFRLANDLLALARRALLLQETLLSATSARVESGIDAPSRTREAAHATDAIRQDIAEYGASRRHALARLAQLLGEETAGLPRELHDAEATYFADDIPLPALPANLPASLLSRRPDIAAADKLREASRIDAERIRLERYPALTLTGSLGFISDSLQRWLRGEALAWLVGGALGGPLLDGGRNAARHAGAQAASEMAEAAWRRQVYTALAEVESALSRLAASETRLAAQNRQQGRLQNALESARQAKVGGRHGRGALLSTELQTLEHETLLRSTRRDHLAAWAASRHALGE